jgi:acetyl-CoA synthetase
MVDDDGQWFIRGRSDDVMNVAGKRLAPAEVESAMITHPRVAEAAAIGVPDTVKGETVWAFWVSRPDLGTNGIDDEEIGAELAALVGRELGKPFTPSRVWRVNALPKTRSAKIMRRAIRAAALGIDPGDLSGAENPDAVGEIRRLVADQALSRRS